MIDEVIININIKNFNKIIENANTENNENNTKKTNNNSQKEYLSTLNESSPS